MVTTKTVKHRTGGRRAAAARSLLMLAGLLAQTPASASNFRVDPVQLSLPADRTSTAVSLKNGDTQPLVIHARAYRWTQKDGADVYTPTTDIILSPPIFTVAPQGAQLVRIGLRTREAGASYRVILEEIPRPQVNSVNVALRLNLPLYILTAGAAKPVVTWKMWQTAAGEWVVEGTNAGGEHLQVTQMDAVMGSAAPIAISRQMGVVLPASARRWPLGKRPDLHVGQPLTLKLQTSAGPLQATVVPEKR